MARSGKNNFGSGFLPAAFQGTDFNAKNPPANLSRPVNLTKADDQATIDLLKRFNSKHLEKYPGDADLAEQLALEGDQHLQLHHLQDGQEGGDAVELGRQVLQQL